MVTSRYEENMVFLYLLSTAPGSVESWKTVAAGYCVTGATNCAVSGGVGGNWRASTEADLSHS